MSKQQVRDNDLVGQAEDYQVQADLAKEQTVVLVDGQWGIYVPQRFAELTSDARWVGFENGDIEILRCGPEHGWYWEAWENVLNSAKYIDKDGREWRLWQDGDLFAFLGNGDQWT